MNRSDEQLFDTRIADWLEEDPTRAPDQALDVVLAAIPSIRQRRSWRALRRFSEMTTPLRFALSGAAVLILAVGAFNLLGPGKSPGAGSLSTPSPSVEPTAASPGLTHYVSPRYGYAVDIPSAYQAIPATEDWRPNTAIGPEEAGTDRFRAGTAFVGIASQPLPDGTDVETWLDAYAQSVADRECGAPASDLSFWTETTVVGHPGRSLSFECGGSAGLEYAWVADGRGWVITGERAVVELMLPTFQLP
jgi:hypothetical protein